MLRRLLESEFDKAQALIASQDLSDSLRSLAEDLQKIITSKYLPLLEEIKLHYPEEISSQWEEPVRTLLEDSYDNLVAVYDAVSDIITQMKKDLEGEITRPAKVKKPSTSVSNVETADNEDDSEDINIDELIRSSQRMRPKKE